MQSTRTIGFSTIILIALWSWPGQAADRHLGDLDDFVGIIVQDGQAFLQDGSERERVALDGSSKSDPNGQSSGKGTTFVPMPIGAKERLSIIWESWGEGITYVSLKAAILTACVLGSANCS